MVIRIPAANETLIGLRHPLSGQWSVSAVQGSAPVVGIALAQSLPAPDVHVHVTGQGARRKLNYRLAVAPGRTVAFVERGPGVHHTLGVARGSRGHILFTPAVGRPGPRQILAVISQGGVPAGQSVVGSYDAQAPARLPAPRHLRVHRTGSELLVSWSGVPGAWRYAATVTLANGKRELLLSRGRQVTFIAVDPAFGGRTQVVPLAPDGQQGRAASASFRPEKAPSARGRR